MRPLPSQKLNPRIKMVWRLSDTISTVGIFLGCFLPFYIVWCIEPYSWFDVLALIEIVLFAAALVLVLFVLPPIRFMRWRYELSEDYLDIAKGIIWRERYIIPFIRVQNTDTRQGPILRALGLSSVTVSTAAGAHEIPGLASQEAEELRDRAAELARLAREDV